MVPCAHIDGKECAECFPRLHLLPVYLHSPALIEGDRCEERSSTVSSYSSGKLRVLPARQMHRHPVQTVINLNHGILGEPVGNGIQLLTRLIRRELHFISRRQGSKFQKISAVYIAK